uniref:Uncharacterized protein n=1 Tax=Sexangularia sp. CB-2014 TaxID=1486929 RepID=A0A7S1VI56_9EUKA
MSIDTDDHYDKFVLADHVPHHDAMPPGGRYLIPVRVPDIACTVGRCSLQVIQIMTDKFSEPCANPAGLADSCGNAAFAYYSCAPLLIDGSVDPDDVEPFYHSFLSNSTADNRTPYQSLSTTDWLPVEGRDNTWTLDEDAVPASAGHVVPWTRQPVSSMLFFFLLLLLHFLLC